jgi:hypothetical protein
MRYQRAVAKLRELAEACELEKDPARGDPMVSEAYVFGDLLTGADPLEYAEVVLVLNRPPGEVVWGKTPRGTAWLADSLRLSKGGFAYWWRSRQDPVGNHHIREPVRFWSHEGGPDAHVLQLLAERRLDQLPRLTFAGPGEAEQRDAELVASLAHLRAVHGKYRDRESRGERRGLDRYPENALGEAVSAYLELYDAAAGG